jgi:hypothetical protein
VKPSMKVLVLAIVVSMSVVAAHADTVDPGIIIRDPVGCPSNQCVSITSLNFSFSVPSGGFGLLHFLNASGVTWTSLTLTELLVPAVAVSCTSDVFSCSVVPFGQNGAKIMLTAVGGLPGILNGHSFEIILGCVKGECPLWPAGMQFDAVANAVPEPGTMAFLLTGLGAMYTRRKLRKQIAA